MDDCFTFVLNVFVLVFGFHNSNNNFTYEVDRAFAISELPEIKEM